MIDKPTHYINESSSCIDLIFSWNWNLTKNCGVKKYHDNIITLNFNIPLLPHYYRELWDFKSANKNNTADIKLDKITMTSGYNQMTDKPTHYINESSSCIDLIFSWNWNLTKNCEVKKCHYNIIYNPKFQYNSSPSLL